MERGQEMGKSRSKSRTGVENGQRLDGNDWTTLVRAEATWGLKTSQG